MFMLFPVYTLLFLSEIISFLHYSTMRKDLFHVQHNTKQTCMFPFSKHQTTLPPQTTIKQARFYKPCIYDKQLGFNKPAVVIADSLFADFRHLCFNGCLCDMRHPFKVGFRNKHTTTRLRSPINKHLSKIIDFTIRQRIIIRPQTARINIICILLPFHVKNHNYANR